MQLVATSPWPRILLLKKMIPTYLSKSATERVSILARKSKTGKSVCNLPLSVKVMNYSFFTAIYLLVKITNFTTAALPSL